MTDSFQAPGQSRHYQYRTDNAELILILLVVTDLIFFALHAFRWWLNSPNLTLGIVIEGGYGEVFQYTKYLWAAILVGWFAAKNRAWRIASWSIVFLYFLAEDSFAIHETLGALVASRANFELPLGLERVDFGDLTLLSAAAALAILVFIAQLGAGRKVKHAFMELAALALIIGLFGVVGDMLHDDLQETDPLLDFILETFEIGGEMLLASLLVWYCFRLQNRCPVFSWRD